MNTWAKEDLQRLTIPQRLELLEALWDSLAETPEHLPLSTAQKAELDRRLASYDESPDEGASWEQVRQRIEQRK